MTGLFGRGFMKREQWRLSFPLFSQQRQFGCPVVANAFLCRFLGFRERHAERWVANTFLLHTGKSRVKDQSQSFQTKKKNRFPHGNDASHVFVRSHVKSRVKHWAFIGRHAYTTNHSDFLSVTLLNVDAVSSGNRQINRRCWHNRVHWDAVLTRNYRDLITQTHTQLDGNGVTTFMRAHLICANLVRDVAVCTDTVSTIQQHVDLKENREITHAITDC